MDIGSKKIFNKINFDISDEGTNQAAAKYTAAVIISLAISETIAIFGLIALIIYNDRFGFYQMLVISAIAMFCFRPRKDELFKLAAKMKQHDNHQILTIQKLIIK
ncbi:MAG: hypothetical protein MUC95_01645 [Spirochaetes bacterium]|nr:hypothetical protein [Spirochaetota bacterium]